MKFIYKKMYLISISIISIIFAIQPFIKKRAINFFTLDEYYIYTQIIGFILVLAKAFFIGLNLTNIKNKTFSNFNILFLSSLTTFIYSFLLNNLLKKYYAKEVIPFIKCGEMVFMYLITLYLDFETVKITQLIGIIFVVLGIYINNM